MSIIFHHVPRQRPDPATAHRDSIRPRRRYDNPSDGPPPSQFRWGWCDETALPSPPRWSRPASTGRRWRLGHSAPWTFSGRGAAMSRRFTIIGIGEVLWDLFPDGPRL